MTQDLNNPWLEFLLQAELPFFDAELPLETLRISEALRLLLRLPQKLLPATLSQWSELCHPDDHSQNLKLLEFLRSSKEPSLSLKRRLYCGDGVYRPFLLRAFCLRIDGQPKRLLGWETELKASLPQSPIPNPRLLEELRKHSLALAQERDLLSRKLALQAQETHRRQKQLEEAHSILNGFPQPFALRSAGELTFVNELFRALAQNPGLNSWASSSQDGDELSGLGPFGQRTFSASVLSRGERGELLLLQDVTELREREQEAWRLRRALRKDEYLSAPRPGLRDDEEPSLQPDLPASLGSAPHDESELLSEVLRKSLDILTNSGLSVLLPSRFKQLHSSLETTRHAELTLGVTGITSSGKSTLVNALMGEPLLPEETRATTNSVVQCRKGPKRILEVEYEGGTKESFMGGRLTSDLLDSLTSERANPGNKRRVTRLTWASPGSVLPEGLTLWDTPGLDACDLQGHTDLVLRELLPSMDLVLYVTSIRSRLKAADMELLNAVLEQGQRVLFLLSQTDLERDDTEGGQVIHSRRQKLAAYVQELHDDAVRAGLKGFAILPVSSRLAVTHFYDRDSAGWQESNFTSLLFLLDSFRTHLSQWKTLARGKRALVLLRRTLADLELLAKTKGDIGRDLELEREQERRQKNIYEIRDSHRWASAEISAVRNEWKRELAPGPHLERMARDTRDVHTLKGIRDRYLRWGADWSNLTARMTERMDRARLACHEILERHGLDASEKSRLEPNLRIELPDFERYIRHQAFEMRSRGWFEDLQFWPKNKTVFRQFVDREKMLEEGRAVLTERLKLLDEHLSWWEHKMREEVCGALYHELAREVEALTETQRAIEEKKLDPALLDSAIKGLQDCESELRSALNKIETTYPSPLSTLPEGQEINTAPSPEESSPQSIFGPLLEAFQEQKFQSRFFSLPTLSTHRRIVLLGLRRHDSLRLLSRLAHEATLIDSLKSTDGREFREDEWLFCGRTPPSLPYVPIEAPDSILNELEVLVAPSDTAAGALPFLDWNDLFAEWLPVVHLDIARIDSGLSDLARAPYAQALPHAQHWIVASGQGALFHTRLSHLATNVSTRLEAFIRLRGYRSSPDWFVYENYDPRYTDFILLGQQLDSRSREEDVRATLALWKDTGLDFRPPFTESALQIAFWKIPKVIGF